MYGLNAFALVCFGAVNVLAVRLCSCPRRIRMAALRAVSCVLLSVSLLRCLAPAFSGGNVRIPLEFSTVSYFAVPLILLSGRRGLFSWAAYSGLMAGFFYYAAMTAAGGPLYDGYPHADVYISLLCHGCVYFCGLVIVGTEKCPDSEWRTLALGTGLVALRALALRPLAQGQGRLFIYELLDAVYVKQLLPQGVHAAGIPLYYLLAAALLALSIFVFFRAGARFYGKYRT